MRLFYSSRFHPLRQLLCRHNYSASSLEPVPRVAIVGSGPAGFYTAQQVLKGHKTVKVDVYEKMPVPFGMVRFGVAPDHQEVKNVMKTFAKTACDKRCQFLGNVKVGKDVSLDQLRKHYTAVVLAYGVSDDKKLGIPRENLTGVLSARCFVGWYNGFPDNTQLKVNLETDTVAIIGQGNVALDVARILLTPPNLLKTTDITNCALESLSNSLVRRVYLIGREGPLQAAFTTAELREMVRIEGCRPQMIQEELQALDPLLTGNKLPRPRHRLMELLYNTACKPAEKDQERWAQAQRDWHLVFHRSPVEFLPSTDGSHVAGVRLSINTLKTAHNGTQQAVPTGETEDLQCGLVIRSIGYKSLPLVSDGSAPFDHKAGVVPSTQGRVTGFPGVYCSGWLKRGPVGMMGATMKDAFETGKSLVTDLSENRLPILAEHVGAEAIEPLLRDKGVRPVSFSDWQKIDDVEESRGVEKGKPREKITTIQEWMEVVGH